jgi:hypothetical protein
MGGKSAKSRARAGRPSRRKNDAIFCSVGGHARTAATRAFAAALVSLASNGYLRIRQHEDWFTLERLREADSSLPPEESTILTTFFYPPSIHTYRFNSRECTWLSQAYEKFSRTMDGIAEPNLMSPHSFLWFSGIAYSVVALVYLFYAAPVFSEIASLASVVYLSIFIFLGSSAFFPLSRR